MFQNFKDIEECFSNLEIYKGDNLLVSSSILKLLIYKKKKKIKFNPNQLIDLLKSKLGKSGNLLFPVYNWDFCKGKRFNFNSSKSETGALGNLALSRKDFKRSSNPIYSFAVCGKNADEICNLKHYQCFGLDSPFGFLLKNNGKNLFIDLDYKVGFSFVHLAEEKVGVSFRYKKKFVGKIINSENQVIQKEVEMYVRHEDKCAETLMHNKLDEILLKKKALYRYDFKYINFNLVKIKTAYEVLVKDLQNKGGLVYPRLPRV